MSACRCRSYNQPEDGQTVPEVVLTIPEWARTVTDGEIRTDRQTVCVDACIAPVIVALWDARIWTLGSCCGHGVAGDRSVIVERSDREGAARVIRSMGDPAAVLAWELVAGDRFSPEPPSPPPALDKHAPDCDVLTGARARGSWDDLELPGDCTCGLRNPR